MQHVLRLIPLSILFVAAALFTYGCGTDYYIIAKKPLPSNGPSPDKARVFFVKPDEGGLSGDDAAFVLNKNKVIGYLESRQVFYVDLLPGEHVFMSVPQRANTDGIKASLTGGKTYYVKLYSTSTAASFWLGASQNVYMEPIGPGTKDWSKRGKWIGGCKLVEMNPEEISAWETKFAEKNAKRLANFMTGEAMLKPLTPEMGE